MLLVIPFAFATTAHATGPLDIWWPTDTSHMTGVQPFKALVEGLDTGSYAMYWQVDGGQLNEMQNSSTGYPHKEATVDVSGWNWHGAGPYTITFVAKQNGTIVAQKSVSIYTTNTAAQTSPLPTPTPAPAATSTITVWWPTKDATLTGTQPFKAVVQNLDVSKYNLYWQVDGGQLNEMRTNTTDGPHKEMSVDVGSWNWQSSGTYTITFVAKDMNGATIATYSEPITVQAAITAQQTATTATQPTSAEDSFYVNPHSDAATQAAAWAQSNPSGAAAMRTLASEPTATWFGNWNSNVTHDVASVVNAAAAAGKTALLVAYNIPQRDCGGYSAGGTSDYTDWITAFANGIGNNKATVILEPDAVPQSSCLSASDQSARFALLAKAIGILKSHANTTVYLDAGHAGWVAVPTLAQELTKAGIAQADGFSLNVSNYDANSVEIPYGQSLSAALGGAHFVIDTSRNGAGSNGQWCNPAGRAIGTLPTTRTGVPALDAYLWIKTPGESDGTCNGGPSAGTWWPDYALGLVTNTH